MSNEALPSGLPVFATVQKWCELSGLSRSMTYRLLAEPDGLRAIRCGGRTLMDVVHGIEFLRSRPAATFGTSKARAA